MRRAIVIAGCHRSGTSALAGALGLLGWQTPETLMPGNQANAPGFWESLPVIRFNESLLEAADRSWLDPKPLPDGVPPTQARAPAQAEALLAAEFPGDRDFVLKDPRISRLLPFWRMCLEGWHIAATVLIACRNPGDVCRSLQERDHLSAGHAGQIWLTYTLDAERGSRGLPRAFVRYEELLERPRETLATALRQVGHDAGAIDETRWQAAVASVRRGTDRPGIGTPDAAADPRIAAVYAACHGSGDMRIFDAAGLAWEQDWRRQDPGDGPSRLALLRPETHMAIAHRRAAQGMTAEALAAAREAAALARTHGISSLPTQLGLSQLFMQCSALDEALVQTELALAHIPRNSHVHYRLGQIHALMGNGAAAEAAFRNSLTLDPDNSKAAERLGLLLFQTNRAASALPLIRQAVAASPEDHRLHHLMALALTKTGQTAAAIDSLRRALALDSGNAVYGAALRRLETSRGGDA